MRPAKQHFDIKHVFKNHLKQLVNLKTCFWDEPSLKKGISYCKNTVGNLPWVTYVDNAGNLICYNSNYKDDQPFLWLSAHIDTVDANKNEWIYDPFTATEIDDYIIGRGVNDCKAGVAFILSFGDYFLETKKDDHYNLGFIITMKEEGNNGKTSSSLNINKIKLSKIGNVFLTLENTVSILHSNQFEIGLYDKEPHNLFIEIKGTLQEIQYQINTIEKFGFKIITIENSTLKEMKIIKKISNKGGGHSATSNDYFLKKVIRFCIKTGIGLVCGNGNEASVMEDKITLIETNICTKYSATLNYRGFESINQIKLNLSNLISYQEKFPFKNGLGSIQSNHIPEWVYNLFTTNCNSLSLKISANPGRSDASAVFNQLKNNDKELIFPIVCGLGCRSHIDINGVHHKTHGINEGFFLPTLVNTLPYFINIINQFKITHHDNT